MNRLHRVLSVFTLAALATAAVPSFAWAQPPDEGQPSANQDEVDRLMQLAVQAYDEKRYDDAVASFEAAYALDKDPNFLFNIGRVHEEAGNLEEALAYYRRFVAEPGVALESREEAVEHIKVLQETLDVMAPDETPEEPAEPAPVQEGPEPEPAPAPAEPTSDRKPGVAARNTGFVLLGVGGAAGIAGGILGGVARADATTLANTDDPEAREQLVQRARNEALAADILLLTGTTLAVTGLIVTIAGVVTKRKADKQTAHIDGLRLRF